jgi:hypothetical protein
MAPHWIHTVTAIARLILAVGFATFSFALCIRLMLAVQPDLSTNYRHQRKIRMVEQVDSNGRSVMRPVVREQGRLVNDN